MYIYTGARAAAAPSISLLNSPTARRTTAASAHYANAFIDYRESDTHTASLQSDVYSPETRLRLSLPPLHPLSNQKFLKG